VTLFGCHMGDELEDLREQELLCGLLNHEAMPDEGCVSVRDRP
jgi:hypothetical protein